MVCERWQSFPNFLADMGHRPSEKHSLDRIDNDGDYKPSNCRWATWEQQCNNRRGLFKGKTQTQWGKILGLSPEAICCRLKNYGDVHIPSWATRALRRAAGYKRTGR